LKHNLDVAPSETTKLRLQQELEEAEERREEIDNASRRLLRAFRSMCEATDSTELPSLPTGTRLLEGTPAEQTVIVMRQYIEVAQTAKLELRDMPTTADPNKTYAQVFEELRHRISEITSSMTALPGPLEDVTVSI